MSCLNGAWREGHFEQKGSDLGFTGVGRSGQMGEEKIILSTDPVHGPRLMSLTTKQEEFWRFPD